MARMSPLMKLPAKLQTNARITKRRALLSDFTFLTNTPSTIHQAHQNRPQVKNPISRTRPQWKSGHWTCGDRRHCALRAVHVCAAGVNRPSAITRCGRNLSRVNWRRNGNVADDLRNGRPLRHALTTRHVRKRDASLRDVTLEVSQSIRAVLIKLALNVILHSSPRHSAKTQAGAVLFHGTDFDDGPDPRHDAQISKR